MNNKLLFNDINDSIVRFATRIRSSPGFNFVDEADLVRDVFGPILDIICHANLRSTYGLTADFSVVTMADPKRKLLLFIIPQKAVREKYNASCELFLRSGELGGYKLIILFVTQMIIPSDLRKNTELSENRSVEAMDISRILNKIKSMSPHLKEKILDNMQRLLMARPETK